MTIGVQVPVSLACDGVTKVFPLAIQAYQAADITVILTAPASAGGAEITLTLNSDYSMAQAGTLNPKAWTLTTLAAAAYVTGYTLQAFINPVQDQQTQYVQGQAFPSLALQTNVDRLTQMVQRLQYQVNRSIRAPDGDVSPAMLLPIASQRLNKVLLTDSAGNVYPGDAASIATVAAYGTAVADTFTATAGQTQFPLSQNPGALANLDVSLDGATLVPTLDYTWNGLTLTLVNGALAGQKLLVRYMQGLPTGISQAAPSYDVTLAEITAGVVPANKTYVPGHMFRYGGVGGSATVDTAAWLAAVAQASQYALGAAEVFVPFTPTGFYVTTGATARRPIKIRGNGSLVSLIVAQSDIDLLVLDNSGGGNVGYACVLEDVGFSGIYTAATGAGITFKSSHDTILRGVRVTGFGIGLNFVSGSSYCVKLIDSRIEGNRDRNIYAGANTHALSMVNVAYGSAGTNLTPIGMTIVDSNTLWQHGCDCEGLRGAGTVVGLDIDATVALAADFRISCHFENNANTVGDIRIGATAQIQGVDLGGTIMAGTAAGIYGVNALNVAGLIWLGAAFFSNYVTANINYGTIVKSTVIPADALTTQGVVSLGNGTVNLPQTASAQVIVNGNTILTTNRTVIRVSEAGNVNSIKLQAGTAGGQDCTIINESAFTVQFDVVGNSNVADGATSAIPALCSRKFTWDSGTSLWYRAA